MEPALEPASENYPCPESCVCEIPVGWFVPVFWCLCFLFLSRNRYQENILPVHRGRRDEVLVAVPVRSDT